MKVATTPDRKTVVLRDDGTWTDLAPSGSVLDRWRALSVPRDIVEQFRGVFSRLGVRIADTGETLTCVHHGDRIEFEAGIDEGRADTAVSIMRYQADRLAEHVERGGLPPIEWFRVARELLAASAGAADRVINSPLGSNRLLRFLIRAKNLVHVYLVSPDPAEEPHATFSLIYVSGRMHLVPGLYGRPQRVFRLTVADALDLQRNLATLQSVGWLDRLRAARWYVQWRRKVERPA